MSPRASSSQKNQQNLKYKQKEANDDRANQPPHRSDSSSSTNSHDQTNAQNNMTNSQEQAPNNSLAQQLQTANPNMAMQNSMMPNQQQYQQPMPQNYKGVNNYNQGYNQGAPMPQMMAQTQQRQGMAPQAMPPMMGGVAQQQQQQ